MSAEILLGLVMLVVMIGAIFIGIQISFTLLFLALSFGYFALGKVVFDLAYFQTIGLMKEEVFAAVPLFIFMGYLTEQAGLMERLFAALRMMLAPVRGSLYIVVIVTSTIFAMATGIVGAAVTVLGIMAAPIMIKTGYDAQLSAGTITAGGTPGFLLAGIYIAYLMVRSFINPKLGPPVPKEDRVTDMVAVLKEVAIGVLPLFLLIGATMGSILAGLATPTEAAGIGALGAMILAVCYGRASYAALKQACISSMMTSSMVLLLAVTSNIFGAVFSRMGTAAWITNALVAMPVPPLLMFAFVIALIFILGWPFEWPAIILVFLPIFYPVVEALKPSVSQTLGVPPDMFMIWFGALVAVTLQTAYLSPPVAMSAYYLKQVVKDWSLGTIYKGMFQFMILQCVAIALVMFVPSVATYLPAQLRAESSAAPAEEADDSMNRLEEDPLKAAQEEEEKDGDPLEKDDLKAKK
jgi:TRAP-type mannitol/chloroaromatic compound transport system permease large subunit